ncbi:unnamed protein product [Lota lota]
MDRSRFCLAAVHAKAKHRRSRGASLVCKQTAEKRCLFRQWKTPSLASRLTQAVTQGRRIQPRVPTYSGGGASLPLSTNHSILNAQGRRKEKKSEERRKDFDCTRCAEWLNNAPI